MPAFGSRSESCLADVHPDLARVMRRAIEGGPDFGIICGHRNEADQNAAMAAGNSKKAWPDSRHNSLPSTACDIMPCGGSRDVWNDDNMRWSLLAGWIMACAFAEGVELTWGGCWSRDWRETRNGFEDLGHFQLK